MKKAISHSLVMACVMMVWALSSGCKTAISHGFGANQIYAGTRFSMDIFKDDEMDTTFADVLDFPLCVVADTVILPITLPCSLFGEPGEFHAMLWPETNSLVESQL